MVAPPYDIGIIPVSLSFRGGRKPDVGIRPLSGKCLRIRLTTGECRQTATAKLPLFSLRGKEKGVTRQRESARGNFDFPPGPP